MPPPCCRAAPAPSLLILVCLLAPCPCGGASALPERVESASLPCLASTCLGQQPLAKARAHGGILTPRERDQLRGTGGTGAICPVTGRVLRGVPTAPLRRQDPSNHPCLSQGENAGVSHASVCDQAPAGAGHVPAGCPRGVLERPIAWWEVTARDVDDMGKANHGSALL